MFDGAHYHVRSMETRTPGLDIHRIRLYGEPLRPFVDKYGLLRSSADHVVPANILRSGRDAQAAYLRALFQAQGTVSLRSYWARQADVTLTTISAALAHGVQALLLNMGIYAKLGRGAETRESRRTPYIVSIVHAESRARFRDLIGFVSDDKREKLDTACSDQFAGKKLPALRDETVVRVECVGVQPVFDIQTESGQYLSNNVIVHNCFIQSVSDDLVNDGGIMDLWTREARIFKYGSGSGTNFSNLRGENEPLSGGGKSSGLMSFLRIGDRAAGAIKSGGTTRRAAKMVILNLDHPDILTFIRWKVVEEQKVAALVSGSRMTKRRLQAVLAAVRTPAGSTPTRAKNPALRSAVREARAALVPEGYIQRVLLLAAQGVREIHFPEYDTDWDSEAYYTVSGQNSNNSVRVPNAFFDVLARRGQWELKRRTDGKSAGSVPARAALGRDRARGLGLRRSRRPVRHHDQRVAHLPRGRAHQRQQPVRDRRDPGGHRGRLAAHRRPRGQDRAQSSARTAQPHLVTRIFPTGRKPVFDLRTRLGYRVRITADHKVLTVGRGDVPVADLTAGNRLMLRGPGFGRRALATELALGVGVAAAEGHLTQSVVLGRAQESLVLSTDAGESPLLAAVAEAVHAGRTALQAVGGLGRQAGSGVITRTAATARLMLSEPAAVAVFREFAILDEGAAAIRFTPAVFDLDRPAAGRGAPRSLHRGRHRGQLRRAVALRLAGLDVARAAAPDPAPPARLRHQGAALRGHAARRGRPRRGPIRPTRCASAARPARSSSRRSASTRRARRRRPWLSSTATSRWRGEDLTDEVLAIEPAGEADVFDLTEDVTHHFVAGGLVVHNCSEYLFLDDTACNLASINVVKFLQEDGSIDVDGFRHACRLWTSVLEISVLMAAYPSPSIAQRSWDFRTLGLGYANMGTVLMRRGIPYDSPEATAICGAMTAIMCGEAYATSAEMARDLGPFPGYQKNHEHMLRVMRNHRRAAYGVAAVEYEGLSITPLGIDPAHCPALLLQAARETWDRAVGLGEQHGYRNAQVTVLAPTGTIGLVMDCDTTGIEPDFSLVKFKKLAGGGYFKIINQSLPLALETLGYTPVEIDDIVAYCIGHKTLRGAPFINHDTLRAKGFDDAGLQRLEASIETAFDITFAFNAWTLGEGYVASRLGINDAQLAEWNGNLLRALGFTPAEIEAANDYCCGTMTVEGAPLLKAAHLPVFDCANRCGKTGHPLHRHRGAHPDDGGGPAVHLGRHQQDHQHADGRQHRGREVGLRPLLARHAQGGGPLPRRVQALAAAQLHDGRGGRAGGGRGRGGGGREDDRAGGHPVPPRAASPARPALRLHPEGGGGRPQGLPAHRRVPGRDGRRDLPRHAQGRGGLPLPDELLRDRDLPRPAARRAARRVRGRVRVHPVRAERDGERATIASRCPPRSSTTSSASSPSPISGAPISRTCPRRICARTPSAAGPARARWPAPRPFRWRWR